MTRVIALATALLLAVLPVDARAWQIDTARSVISFVYEEDGKAKRGVFRRFGGTLDYDAENAKRSTAALTVSTASLALGDILREGVLETPEWLDSTSHPKARFTLGGLEPRGGEGYDAMGTLEIKGIQHPVRFPVTLHDDGREARATGDIAFSRRDFRLRDPLLESIISIGETVRINFDIVALRESGDVR